MEAHQRLYDETPEGRWRPVARRLQSYLQTRRGLADYTLRNYLTDLLPFWHFLDSQKVQELQDVDRGLVRAYLYWLLTEARPLGAGRRRGAGYATPSVARKLSALRTLFAFLVQEGDVPADPTLRIASTRTEQRLPEFLDLRGVLVLLEAPPETTPTGIRDRAILEMLYASGVRVSELTGLDVADLDLEHGQARVLGKGSRQRMVLLGAPAIAALERYLRLGRLQARGARRDPSALFLNRYGGRLTQRSVQRVVRRYGLQAELAPNVHPHTLRHTFATHLLDGGADLRVVQELLGHATPATTQLYTHVTQEAAQRVYRTAHPRAGVRQAEGGGHPQAP